MPALLRFLSGVRVSQQAIIAVAAVNAANQLGLSVTMYVTSGNDKVHRPDSKHYEDKALDFRTKHLSTEDKHAWKRAIKQRLGRDYDVILEFEGGDNEHLHIEFDPK